MDPITQERIKRARAAGWDEDTIQRMVLQDQARAQRQRQAVAPQPTEKTFAQKVADAEVFGVHVVPLATGTIGAIGGGLVAGPAGAVAGGALGSSLGEALRQKYDTTEGYQPGKIIEEGVYGGLGELGGQVVGRVGGKVLSRFAKPIAEGTEEIAGQTARKFASGFLKETPSQWLKAAEAGIDPNELLLKWVPKLGTNLDELLGKGGGRAFGHSGTIQEGIRAAEETIQGISKQAGRTVKLSGDDLIAGLFAEKKIMQRQLGSSARVEAIDKIITEAQRLYKNGITVNHALDILREANQKFGASILDDTADAVATAAQKLQANTIRKQLRTMFPAMAEALDTQQELITLRELLKGTVAKNATGGFKLGRLDLTRPGTIFDAIASSGPMMKGTAKLAKAAATDYSKVNMGVQAAKKFMSQAGSRILSPFNAPETSPQATDFSSPDLALGGGADTSGVDTGMNFNENPQQVQEGGIPSQEQFKQAYWNAVMAGDSKAASMIKDAADYLHSEGVGVTLSDTAIQSITDLEGGIRGIDSIISMVSQPGSQTGPISGQAARLPWATNAKTVQAEINRVKQKVGKALEGGVLRKEDEEKYKQILPTITDTEEVAMNKLMRLKQELTADLTNYVNLQTSHGKGAGQPTSAANLRFSEQSPQSFYASPDQVNFDQSYAY